MNGTSLVAETHSRLPASGHRWARFAVATAFFVNGAVQANWVTRIPAVQEELGLSAGTLGTALLGLPLGLVAIVPITGWLIARFGSRLVTRSSTSVYCLTLVLPALATNLPLLFLALVVFGAGAGALDVAMNTHAVAVERRYGRPILSSFHGLFSVGGLAGAAAGGAVVALGVGTTQHLLGAGLSLGIVALAASRWLLPSDADAARTAPTFALPSWSLVGLGVIAFCVLLGEGAMADWSAVYLQGEIGTGPGLAAAGFAAFSSTMAAGRLMGDRINQLLGPTTLTRLGAGVATVGLLAALVTDRPVVAILGFACVGLGFSTVFPVVVSAAGNDATGTAVPRGHHLRRGGGHRSPWRRARAHRSALSGCCAARTPRSGCSEARERSSKVMNTTIRHETDVLIVGAGPTGLTLACELLRRGVRCRIIDKASAPATTSRALGLQPRTLELFDTMGIVDRVLSTGGPVIDANLYDGDRLLLTLSTAGVQALDTPYPRLWITPQTSVERPLEARLGELGGAVERACEFVGLREEDSRVIATVKRGDGPVDETEQVRAGWLVGCDGAHSRVRRTLDVTFEGSTYEEKFLLADVDLDWSRERNRTHTWFPPDGMFTVFPLPGSSQWRIFAVVEGETVPPVSLELFQRLFRERTGDATTTVSNPTWMSNFTINRRMVDRYQVGRIFLAGDAAHIHSPFGAQGMNTGIQDAYNLGWKLALVVSGKASEYLLDTYEEERLPVAKRVLAQTDANTRVLLSDNPVVRFLREHVLTLDAVQDYLARRSSQLFVNYRASSLSRSYQEPMMKALLGRRGGEKAGVADRFDFRAAPHAGDRAPNGMAVDVASREETSLFREFRGTHFSLLLFDGLEHTEAGYANLSKIARQVEALLGSAVKPYIVLSTDEVPEQLEWNGSVLLDGSGTLHELYGAGAESLYLIRPDGYVGLRGQPAAAEPLLEYLDCMEEGLGVSSSRDATRAIEPDHGHGKEVTAMKQKMTGERVAYVAPGRGGSVWIGDRELVTFKQTGAETGGLFALVEVVGLPGSGPPPHIHHRVDEVYCLLEGELEILDGDRTFTAEAGSVFRIPKGTLHAWKNRTDEPARTLLFICPAGFEGFFEEAGVQASDPSSPPPPPTQEDLRRMLELGRKYETEYPTLPNQ